MSKKTRIVAVAGTIVMGCATLIYRLCKEAQKTTYRAEKMEPITVRKKGIYEKYIKRLLDNVCGVGVLVCFSPLYLVVMIFVGIKLGFPVLFTQERPGMIGKDGKEIIFKMYKFRSMTDQRDENGELYPDYIRLTPFGKWLRETSLDELGEVINIINGTMSVVGPRPQLVRDMVFMTDEQRMRHTAKPGLSGLAQINGRNSIKWEEKLDLDLKYIENITFLGDIKIILNTVGKAFITKEGVTGENMATSEDFGDYLLRLGKISQDEYNIKQEKSKSMLR